jgi:hypothetical protein
MNNKFLRGAVLFIITSLLSNLAFLAQVAVGTTAGSALTTGNN